MHRGWSVIFPEGEGFFHFVYKEVRLFGGYRYVYRREEIRSFALIKAMFFAKRTLATTDSQDELVQ